MKSCPEAVGRDAAQNFVDRTDAKIPDSFRRIQRSLASGSATFPHRRNFSRRRQRRRKKIFLPHCPFGR
jgi:hypothetical protein